MGETPARPAALEAMVAAAARAEPRPLPREQPSPTRRAMKLAHLGDDGDGSALGLLWFALMLAGAILGPLWLQRGPRWLGAAACAAVAAAVWFFHRRGRAIQRDRAQRLAGGLGATPFPVEGLMEWLTADRPLADVYLRAPVAPALLEQAVRVIDARAELDWLGPTQVRIALTPRRLRAARHKAPELLGGDLALLRALVERVLGPLHAEVAVDRVELGGEVIRDDRGPV